MTFSFKKALSVWLDGKENEMNITAAFEEQTGSLKDCDIYIAAATFYRLFVNGCLAAFGPARTAKGYARVDSIPLEKFDRGEGNTVRIEVVSYNCRSLSTCRTDGFLCAEIRRGDDVLYYTGRDFKAYLVNSKLQHTERFSVQRHFGEVWDFREADACVPTIVKKNNTELLPRSLPYPIYEDFFADKAISRGTFEEKGVKPEQMNLYSWEDVPEYWGRFDDDEIEYKPYRTIISQQLKTEQKDITLPLKLSQGEFALFDLKRIECGFMQLDITTQMGADVIIGFSEYCENGEFSFTPIQCQNVIECIFPSCYSSRFISFEPNTLRFAVVAVKSGSVDISSFGVKSFERDMSSVRVEHFTSKRHEKIYSSALRTFAHNAADIYTDCPSRERAGWLCDSYFTACAEYHFFGNSTTEEAFLENYRLCRDELLPEGMLPMCYPSDIIREADGSGQHIPQWCMWYVLEVKEYLTERKASADKELFRESVEGIVKYFEKFENADGLLQDLPSWNFVEWSDANRWTRNVNYPTNFLYSAVLLAAHELFGNEEWKKKAVKLKARTAELSFDGEFFTDNALLNDKGVLTNTGNTSEACQYYALLFADIDINSEKYSTLREFLLISRKTNRQIVPVNAFIGFYLRLKWLLSIKEYKLILDDVESFFGHMAAATETLWEYREPYQSLDHGFASYAAYAMCIAAKMGCDEID